MSTSEGHGDLFGLLALGSKESIASHTSVILLGGYNLKLTVSFVSYE